MRYLTAGNVSKLRNILIQRGYSWYEAEDIALRLLSVSSKKGGATVEEQLASLPAPSARDSPKTLPRRRMKRVYTAANPEHWRLYTTFPDVPGVLLINRNAERGSVIPFPGVYEGGADMVGILNLVARNHTPPTTA